VVVNDNGNHLCGGEVWVVETTDESQMILSRKGLSQELLPPTRWKKDQGVTQVNNRHSTTVIKSPSMADRRWDRHLPTRRDQKLSRNGHGRSFRTW
jgi:hypothetical protein